MNSPETRLFPSSLRALSIHAPWAWLICKGLKPAEYRTWATRFRGLVLLHTSASRDSDEIIHHYSIPRKEIHGKAIIGAVTVTDCQPAGTNLFAFFLKNPIQFPQPIQPVSGSLSFWKADTPERVRAFNQAWEYLSAAQR